jgi:Winged helix DNA-binding domain
VAGPVRVLTARQLNRALLARQYLLDRSTLEIHRTLEKVAGLQAQYAPSMYIGLWSRVEGFERGDLTQALERRTVVQGTLQRETIHLVSARDYWPFAVAVRQAGRRWWLRTHGRDIDEAEMEQAAERVRRRLADGPVRRPELDQIAGPHLASGVGLWIDLVRVPPSGTWERRRADLFGLASDWVPASEVSPTDAAD